MLSNCPLGYGHGVSAGSENQGASGRDSHGRESWIDPEGAQQRLEQWGSRFGRAIAVAAARVREEAQDMWAEAQSIRRGECD